MDFTAQPVRVSALLRLPLIALIAILVWFWEVEHWLPVVYGIVLGGYAAAAVIWLIAVMRGPVAPWADWVSTGVDVAVIITLCVVSGGATAALLPVFFLLPISVAFQEWPALTGIISIGTALCYLTAWIIYSKRDDTVGLPDIIYTHFGFLLWLAVATTALCFVLNRRQARVNALHEVRRQLVAEALVADERHNRELAEHLHDGPLQAVLSARLELTELRERSPDPALDYIYDGLEQAAVGLRSTVAEMHPEVLIQLGLTAGVRELVQNFAARTGCTVEAQLDDVGQPQSQVLLYRAARELLTNIGKHAGAGRVDVSLRRHRDRIILTITDDGPGFDPSTLTRSLADGHIGLASLTARFEAMEGSVVIDSKPGRGTRITVTSPSEPQ